MNLQQRTNNSSHRKKRLSALFGLLLAFSANLFAQIQVVNNILPPDIEACAPLGVFNINANYPPTITIPSNQLTGTGYSTQTIPFAPTAPAGTAVALTDDGSAGPFPIGFPFNFYGTVYNNFYVSANGYIGFTPPLPGTFSYNADDMEDPCAANNLPFNAIFGWYQDFNPNGVANAVQYQTTGTAPNRVLTVYFNNLPFFSTCGGTATFQIKIYETTGIIQVIIDDKPQCVGMWQGDGLTGLASNCPIANNGGCPAYSYSGSDIAINNQAWQYTPVLPGSGIDVVAGMSNVTWQGIQGAGNTNFTVNGTNTTAQVSMLAATQAKKRFIIKVTYDVPCANDVVLVDTFVVHLKAYDASFTATSPICIGNTSDIQFTGSPTPSASALIAWNFGSGGNPATANTIGPFNQSWTTTGTKTITLNLSGGGCAPGSSTQTVEVTPSPTSTFTATSSVCGNAPATITYTGNAPANATYTWNFDGGTAVPASGQGPFNVTWTTPGVKNVKLTVSIGSCSSVETTVQVTVNPAPTSTFTVPPGGVCVGEPIELTYTGTAPAGATYTWGFNGGTAVPGTGQGPISVTWDTPGNKSLTLQVDDNGCISNTTTVPVTVHAIPLSTFTVTPAVCPNQNATTAFTGTAAAGNVYTWSFDGATVASGAGAGPYNLNWPTDGTYDLTLQVTSAQGCESVVSTQQVTVNPVPTATFTATPAGVCVGQETTLQHTGNAPAGSTFVWNFDSGTATPGDNLSPTQDVSWNAAGTRNVTLRVVAAGCSSSVETRAVTIFPTPTATFTTSPNVCPGASIPVNYTGTGTGAATYTWSFNGGTVTGPTNPGPFDVSWTVPGNKAISLVVAENGCASQPYQQNVNVYQQPTSLFSASSPVCSGSPSNVSYLGNAGNSATYNWTFAGGTPAAPVGQGPHAVIWNTPGTYFLNLTVTENGCVSPATQIQVVVNPIPTSSFTVSTPICLDGSSTITYTGNAPANAVYNWSFAGGNTPIQVGQGPFTVNWSTPGIKNLTLDVNSLGCQSSTSTQTLEVLPLPVADAGLNQQSCSGASVTLGVPAVAGYTYSWTPSTGLDNPNAAQPTATRQNNLAQPVDYEYILTVNDGSCDATDTVLYRVTAPPFVSFSAPPGQCMGGNSFNFLAEGQFSNNSQFIWSFGANANVPSSSVINPSNISFGNTGSQTITLQVNDGGCFSNLYSADVLVYPDPIVDFVAEVNSGCADLKVDFNNLSQAPGSVTYNWYFGDGGTSTSPEPSYLYTRNGLYDVSLKAITANGCVATKDRKEYIEVYPVPNPFFSMSASELDIISPDLSIQGGVLNTDSVWYFVTNFETDTLLGPNHAITFEDTGYYQITQVVINDFGCIDSVERFIKVNPGYRIYIPNSFSPNKDGVNDVFKVYGEELSDFEIVIFNRWGQQIYASYDLDNGWDGTTALSTDEVQGGVYLYVVKATDDRGFEHKFEGTVNVIR